MFDLATNAPIVRPVPENHAKPHDKQLNSI